MTWEVAFAECCKFGLWPVDVNSQTELQCINSAFPGHNKKIFVLKINMSNVFVCKGLNSSLWTSGTNSGPLSESNHHFCSSDAPIDNSMWIANNPSKPWTNRCVAIQFNLQTPAASGLVDTDCAAPKAGVICKAPWFVGNQCNFSYLSLQYEVAKNRRHSSNV